MKRTLSALLIALSVSCSVKETVNFTNPVLHFDYSDPDVCRVGDHYYMTASSFNFFPGLPILRSADLVHWEQVGAALADYPAPEFHGAVQHGCGVWAPAIRYHDGWFYIYVGDPDRGVFMVKTQDVTGRWEAPVWVVREKGFIDPCPLWDSEGNAWLSHGAAGSRAGLKSILFVAPMKADGTALTGPSRLVFDGHLTQPTIEGTKFYERDGWYYIFAPAGGVATGWQTVLRSRSVYGPYEEKIVMAWAPGTVNGPHQGAWVTGPDGGDWFLHFQDKGAYGRIVHLQPMTWRSDGWPLIGEDPDGDGVGQPVSSGRMAVSGKRLSSAGNGFPAAAVGPYGLDLSWQYPSVPGPYWHRALPDGGVRLYSVKQEHIGLWECPNLLERMFPAERFTTTAKLLFHPNPQLKERGECAGFVVMGESYAGVRVVDTADGAALQYIECTDAHRGGQELVQPLALLDYTLSPQAFPYSSGNVPAVKYPAVREVTVWLRLEVAPQEVEGNVPDAVCRFSYSLDGETFTPAGEPFVAAPGRWIGARQAFFCNRQFSKNDSGWVDIDLL